MQLPFASIYRLFYAGWLFSFGIACTQVPVARAAKVRPKCVRGKGRGASPPQTPTMTAGSSALQAGIVRDDRRSARLKKTLAANALLSLAIFASLAGCAATAYPDLNRQPMPRIAESCEPHGTVTPLASAGTAEQVVERIQVTADPESAGSLVSRAWDASRAGNREKTIALYDLALQRADNSWPRGRIEWSYGWSMFNLKEHACALAHFEEARIGDPTFVQWVPYTYAVTWWQLGQRDLGIDWYDEAVRTNPACWREIKSAGQCSSRWLAQEKRALAELLFARKARRFAESGRVQADQLRD